MADLQDPVARARAIAARLASTLPQNALGKRKDRGEDDDDLLAGKKRKKVYIPVDKYPDVNFMGLLIGPKGSHQKRMEEESGARILIRGKGSSKDPSGEPDGDEEMHVLITGDTDDAIARAQSSVENILYNPQEAQRLKSEQLKQWAEMNGTYNENYRASAYAPEGDSSHYGPASTSDTSVQTEMEVPREMVGYVIGRGGETIRDLQTKSGAHIQVIREDDGAPLTAYRSLSMSGPQDTIDKAKALVQQLIDERMSLNQQGPTTTSTSASYKSSSQPPASHTNPDGTESIILMIPNDRVGLLIGRGGTTIKSLQMRTQANVHIPQTPDESDPNMRRITISGTYDQKESARQEVMTLMSTSDSAAGGQGAAPQYGNAVVYMTIPNERVGVVIGKGGVTIKSIQERYQVKVQIPQVPDPGSNPPVRTIGIHGHNQEYVNQARGEIDQIVMQGAGGGGGYNYSSVDQSSHYAPSYDASAYYGQYYQEAQPASTEETADDPNAYWNGFYDYAAYYGIEAANAAWGVTGEAAQQSVENYRQYMQQTEETSGTS